MTGMWMPELVEAKPNPFPRVDDKVMPHIRAVVGECETTTMSDDNWVRKHFTTSEWLAIARRICAAELAAKE